MPCKEKNSVVVMLALCLDPPLLFTGPIVSYKVNKSFLKENYTIILRNMAECPSLGAVKGRYLSVANADPSQNPENDEAESDNEENQQLVDKNGELIEKSGGKERVVSSAEGVKNIKALFGGKQQSTWQKPSNVEAETPSVDASSVNSARSMFKNFDQQKQSNGDGKSFNRPTVKKRDAKELMEQRKKATYGDDDADIQDGVVKKSVVIDQEEIASSNRKEALNKYKELESSKNTDNNNAQKNRPTNRLMSDNDVKDEFNRRSESISSSVASSEQGDVGYEGSVSPCSPNSEMSDDYISDETPKDEKGIRIYTKCCIDCFRVIASLRQP